MYQRRLCSPMCTYISTSSSYSESSSNADSSAPDTKAADRDNSSA